VRGWKLTLLFVGLLFWIVAGIVGAAALAYERSQVGASDLSCPRPYDDSDYGPSHWQWWPPGRVCEQPTTAEPSPTAVNGAVVVMYVAGLGGLLFGTVSGFRSYIRVRLTEDETVTLT
jgi:hypothetical protein